MVWTATKVLLLSFFTSDISILNPGPMMMTAEAKISPNGGMVWDGNGWIALVDDDSDPEPYPPKTDSWKHSDTTMFIGVSSFRDKRCPNTLKNYFTKAKYPERLTVGVVQQNNKEDVDCVTEYCKLMGAPGEGPSCPYFDNIKTVRVEAKLAAGPCFGRHMQVGCCCCSVYVIHFVLCCGGVGAQGVRGRGILLLDAID